MTIPSDGWGLTLVVATFLVCCGATGMLVGGLLAWRDAGRAIWPLAILPLLVGLSWWLA